VAELVALTETQCRAARRRAWRFSRRATPELDLLAELDERLNAHARYQVDLEAGDFTDGNAEQLQGGMAYEQHHIEAIASELEARARAHTYGFRPNGAPAESDLKARFAAAKAIDTADVLGAVTGQPGRQLGDRLLFSCPFHDDPSPSLLTYPGDRGWHCFQCGRGGDAVALLAELKTIGMVEALRLLESGSLGVRMPS
jgi:hypothetical protein